MQGRGSDMAHRTVCHAGPCSREATRDEDGTAGSGGAVGRPVQGHASGAPFHATQGVSPQPGPVTAAAMQPPTLVQLRQIPRSLSPVQGGLRCAHAASASSLIPQGPSRVVMLDTGQGRQAAQHISTPSIPAHTTSSSFLPTPRSSLRAINTSVATAAKPRADASAVYQASMSPLLLHREVPTTRSSLGTPMSSPRVSPRVMSRDLAHQPHGMECLPHEQERRVAASASSGASASVLANRSFGIESAGAAPDGACGSDPIAELRALLALSLQQQQEMQQVMRDQAEAMQQQQARHDLALESQQQRHMEALEGQQRGMEIRLAEHRQLFLTELRELQRGQQQLSEASSVCLHNPGGAVANGSEVLLVDRRHPGPVAPTIAVLSTADPAGSPSPSRTSAVTASPALTLSSPATLPCSTPRRVVAAVANHTPLSAGSAIGSAVLVTPGVISSPRQTCLDSSSATLPRDAAPALPGAA